MKILSKYLLKEIVSSVLLVLLALTLLLSFFDLINELEDLGKGSYSFEKIMMFVVLSMPGNIYDLMPVAVLVGCMLSLGQLAKHSELIVLRVSGISVFRLLLQLLKIGIFFSLLTFLIGELITPISETIGQRIRIKATHAIVAQEFKSGLWVKDGTSFVNVKDVLPDTSLKNIDIYEFDVKSKLIKIRNAQSAQFENDLWQLSDVTNTYFDKETIHIETFPKDTWQSSIRPELLNILLVLPEKMSAWNLYSYIKHLTINKQNTTRYEIAIWAKVVYPLACLVMVILALPFSFIQQRATGASGKVVSGIALGIVYIILNRVFSHLGLLNNWSPLFSAMTPTLVFLSAGLTMLYLADRR